MSLSNDWPRQLDQDWRTNAACRGMDPNLFHPTPITQLGANRQRPKLEQRSIAWAKSICAGCPVGAECEADGTADAMSICNGKLPEERTANPATISGRYVCGTDAGYRAHYRRGDRGDDVCEPCRAAHRAARSDWEQRRLEATS